MPELVRGCYSHLTNNNDNVILITKENFRDYCDIPTYILQKVERGNISFTHFSDILRVSLLSKWGGMWLDSTCWVSGKVPDNIFEQEFFTPHTRGLADMPSWSNSRWCGWGTGTCMMENPLFVFARNVFYRFYDEEDVIPFYLFIDYLYDYAYRHIPAIKNMVDSQPENNTGRNALHFLLNSPYDENKYLELCMNTWLFKLSYKTPWKKETNGNPTFYGKLICGN